MNGLAKVKTDELKPLIANLITCDLEQATAEECASKLFSQNVKNLAQLSICTMDDLLKFGLKRIDARCIIHYRGK